MEEETTTIRVSKKFLSTLNEVREEAITNNELPTMSYEEFLEYLMAEHLIFEGRVTKNRLNNMRMGVAEHLELSEEYSLPSYQAMRSALKDYEALLAGIYMVYENMPEEFKQNITEEQFLQVIHHLQSNHDILVKNKVDFMFVMEQ